MARKNHIKMHSLHNEVKSVIAERLLNDKVYKHMTSISKNIYIHKLGDIVNKYNNIYHRTIKMKPVDVKHSTYIDCSKKSNDEDLKNKARILTVIKKSMTKILNLKLVTLLEYQNIKAFLNKATLQIGLKRFL